MGAATTWNLSGLIDFAVVAGIGILSSPAVRPIVSDGPGSGTGSYPLVMIPAFAVAGSIIPHALSLRRLRWRNAVPPRTIAPRLAAA